MAKATTTPASNWPVLRRYTGENLHRVALPLGGIGTGTISLGGRGQLRDWEVMSRPAKGFTPRNAFFALYAKPDGGAAVTRVLEGLIPAQEYEGAHGCPTPNHGLPRFRECSFETAYPLGQIALSDPDVPLSVRLKAFNPLVPGDVDSSSLPLALLRFELTNRTARKVEAAICGNTQNFIGYDGFNGEPLQNVNTVVPRERGWCGIAMRSDGIPVDNEFCGTMALATNASRVTQRTAWKQGAWSSALLDFWDDFSSDGKLEERELNGFNSPVASLAANVTIAPHATASITFIIAWHFPNRVSWTPPKDGDVVVGNHYTTLHKDAWDVVRCVVPRLPQLEARTLEFVRAFCGSDLPDTVKEAALFNLSTLRTQTCFRIATGQFMAWEGCGDTYGSCHGSCTHVWNYETATAFLFADLARSMRETEFLLATADNGLMSFRVNLPLERAQEYGKAAADGQLGCIMKVYRDWQLCGDTPWLRSLWPKVRQALEFCWIPGGWDADRDGVMEGCQHNTMDVEYYGPNPQMQFWYLGALRAATEMAHHLGEDDFANHCHDLFEKGSAWIDANLFNGDYYEQEIRPPQSVDAIAPGLCVGMGAVNLENPSMQLGPGCLVDQLVGQYMAHVCGLGYLASRAKISRTLRSIMKLNFKKDFFGHFNNMRSYVMNGESALLMATYPPGRRPKHPFPYFNEVMTGFEYTAATHMLYEGQRTNGLKVIKAIRDRYDGHRRNPFNEAECGHHYGRAMASWSAVLALSGFHYSAVSGTLTFAARPGNHFWSTGHAWGTCKVTNNKSRNQWSVTIEVIYGSLHLKTVTLNSKTTLTLPRHGKTLKPGKPTTFMIPLSKLH